MIVGDFNTVLSQANKLGGRPVVSSSTKGFRQFVEDMALIDMGFVNSKFTWNNRREGVANIQERLDRGFANDCWKIQFPHATVTHLSALGP